MRRTFSIASKWLRNNYNSFMLYEYPLEAFYKMPLAFHVLNQNTDGDIVQEHIESHFNRNYYFMDDYNKDRRCDHYYDFWLFLNYTYTGNSDSVKTYKRILESYDGEGAFSNSYNRESDEYEVRATAFGGICSYFMKEYAVLKNSADFLIKIFDYNKGKTDFCFIFDGKFNQKTTNVLKNKRLYYYNREQNNPLYYSFYLAVINLALTYWATKDIQYLKYAENYYNYLVLSEEVKYNSYSGKLGIASALLYVLTKKSNYIKVANEIIKFFIKTQSDKGFWFIKKGDYQNIRGVKDSIINIDRTSEFIISMFVMNRILNCTKES